MKIILDKIENANTICVFRHQSPDPDALGSQFGLVSWIKETYPEKHVFAMGWHRGQSANLFGEYEAVSDDVVRESLAIILDPANKARIDDENALSVSPEEVVALAKKHRTPSIAFTYNDPTIFGEYVIDISSIAREEGIKSVMVTAGYIDKNARKDVYKYVDAANVDLKAFTEDFYHKITSSHLNYVLDTLVWLKKETEVWIEITTLLIPGENDSEKEIKQECEWI
ncbi:MAG: radical SAM protein, partial [Erysipelotrichaceae bacterium]|nr:radical SAM protein [Erysipelotrichaceae bacterium]